MPPTKWNFLKTLFMKRLAIHLFVENCNQGQFCGFLPLVSPETYPPGAILRVFAPGRPN
jgi:hypothetical protein